MRCALIVADPSPKPEQLDRECADEHRDRKMDDQRVYAAELADEALAEGLVLVGALVVHATHRHVTVCLGRSRLGGSTKLHHFYASTQARRQEQIQHHRYPLCRLLYGISALTGVQYGCSMRKVVFVILVITAAILAATGLRAQVWIGSVPPVSGSHEFSTLFNNASTFEPVRC